MVTEFKMCDCTNAKALIIIIIMFLIFINEHANVEAKQSRYRPEQAQKVDTGIPLSFRGLGVRRGCVVSITPQPLYPGKDPIPVVEEVGWAPGPVLTCAKIPSVVSRYTDRDTRPTLTSMFHYRLAILHSKGFLLQSLVTLINTVYK
jgi:hypothetical protein